MVIQIWDLPLRLFHWLLVFSIIAAYVTSELDSFWLIWHAHIGIFTLTLMVFRIAWGFMGSSYAIFSSFIPLIFHMRAYSLSDWSGVGHNPLGSLSIILMLSVILTQACFGLFALNDEIEFHGPLYDLVSAFWSERLTAWHRQLFYGLVLLITLHLAAISYYTWFKRKKLIMPMITGKTWVADETPFKVVRGSRKIHLLLAVCMSAMVFWCIESGALLRWITAALPEVKQTITTPVW